MKRTKKILCLLLVLLMMFSMAACLNDDEPNSNTPETKDDNQNEKEQNKNTDEKNDEKNDEENDEELENITFSYYSVGEEPTDSAKVLEVLNQKLEEKLNVSLEINYSTWSEWKQKYNLELTSGTSDIMFSAHWADYGSLAFTGAFIDIEELLPLVPTMQENIPAESFNMCRVDGGIYGIPNTYPEYVSGGIQYREDLRVKYNLPIPNSIENFEAYMVGIQENEPNQGLMNPTIDDGASLINIFEGAQVLNYNTSSDHVAYGYLANYDHISELDEYWYSEQFVEDMKLMKKWADMGFWSRSALSDPTDITAFENGAVVANVSGRNPNKYISAIDNIKVNFPDAEVGYVAYGETTGVLYPTHATQNLTVITRACEDPERALKTIETLMFDEEIHRVLQYGIEGTHYEVSDDGLYLPLSDTFRYEGFNTWNLRNGDLTLARESDVLLNSLFDKYYEIGSKCKYPNVNIVQGFIEDYTSYEVERSGVSNVMRQYLAPLQAGLVEDVDAAVAEFRQEAKNAGIDACRESFKAQWKAYCEEYGFE